MKRLGFTSVLVCLLFALFVPFKAAADTYERGDVSKDGRVDVADVTLLIKYVLNSQNDANGDVNRDGRVDVADVTFLIQRVLNGYWSDDYVDLGLPSGTLWATRNIGANSPEDYGDYFAWGETSPKNNYDWSTYEWCNGSMYSLTKYNTTTNYGIVDNKTELDLEDDAAYVNWGPSWRMPTKEQQDELRERCTWTWTTRSGVNGCQVTGPNGNSIFLPAAGDRWDGSLDNVGSYGLFWSRTLDPGSSFYAYGLNFHLGYVYWDGNYRDYGLTVRAVRVP